MAGIFPTSKGGNLNSVALMLFFAVTLLSEIGLRDAATCSKLLDNYDITPRVYSNGTGLIFPYLSPVLEEKCRAWCTQSCLCVGYVYFSASFNGSGVNCFTYMNFDGETIQDSNATLYKRRGAPTCSNPSNTYESTSGVYDAISRIYVSASNVTECQNSCTSSCLCLAYAFDNSNDFLFTSFKCYMYWELSGQTTKDPSVTLYKRQGLSTSAGSGNFIAKTGGILGGVFNLLLIGGGLFLSVYFTN